MVVRYKYLEKVLQKSHVGDYFDLQCALGPNALDFSDNNMDGETTVMLTNPWLEAFESRCERSFDAWVTRGLSLLAIVIAAIALLAQLGILQLQRCLRFW